MVRYLKIPANPDSSPCRCTSGDPDCDHFEFCPECGAEYKAHEGHDCIDGVPVQDLRGLAKELRDALASCETERDRLRAELDAAHDGEDALRSEVAKLRAQIAALQAVPQGVEVPELIHNSETCQEIRAAGGHPDFDKPVYEAGYNLARSRASLVPTPPQPAPVAALDIRFPDDFGPGTIHAETLASRIANSDPRPLQPEERRVGPDEVVVGREEWEAVQEFADLIVPIRDNLSGISWIGKLSDVFAAYDHWYAVRISAQAHNGEESK